METKICVLLIEIIIQEGCKTIPVSSEGLTSLLVETEVHLCKILSLFPCRYLKCEISVGFNLDQTFFFCVYFLTALMW